MSISYLSTNKAPKAIGPYSQATKIYAGDISLIYTSGQIAIDPETNKFLCGDIIKQTTRVCENLKALLEANGSGLSRVLKTTVFLTDIDEFEGMNMVYGEYFSHKPARSTVQVAKLPLGAKVEIEVVAYY